LKKKVKLKNKSRESRKLITYFLISIPGAIALNMMIEYKNEVLFWTYLIIALVSALITRWYGYSNKKSKFLKVMECIAFVSWISLFLWYFADTVFYKS